MSPSWSRTCAASLGCPHHQVAILGRIGSSWQSREIASGVLFGATGLVFAAAQWFGWFPRAVREVLAAIAAIAGFLLVFTMAGTYYSVETIPAWHAPATWIFFFCSAILTGSLAVGVALLVTWNMQSSEKPGAMTRLAARWRLISQEPMTDELNKLTTKSLQGVSFASALAGVVILVTYPIYILGLSNGNEAAQEVASRLVGPTLIVRLVLLAVVIILAGVFAFVRARSADKPNKVLAWIIVTAFILAVVTELLGRGLHYEGLWHVGLNTSQYLLGK